MSGAARLERVLVTGAAGFIGSAFVRRLLARRPQARVIGVDILHGVSGSLHNLAGVGADRHRFVRADVCDASRMAALVADEDIDTIVHFAAETHVDRSIDGPGVFVRTNVQGTWSLLEAARSAWLGPGRDLAGRRFHQISTDEVFGDRRDEQNVAHESSLREPRSPYAASKAAADHLVAAWRETYGLPVSITLSSNNIGPRQHPEKLVPLVILRALAGEPIPLYGDGMQVRRWIHVDDHVDAILAVLAADTVGETFAVGPDRGTTNLDLVRRVCGVLDRRRPEGAPHARLITHVADRPGHDRVYHTDAGRIRQRLGWRPRYTLDAAVEDTVDWYLAHPDWVRR
ncbi:MAG: dTDP-glucose 4,6-dehydratase, partial [Deltaproteobacteria bacterium]